mgnify:CR=1 FL=1
MTIWQTCVKNFALAVPAVLVMRAFNQTLFATKSSFTWPDGARAAVSLAYDDAINSQLDHAIPALDKYGLKGSFYLTLSSETLSKWLSEWRAAAANGHELGNHTLFHQCSRKAPGHEWVDVENDLDNISVAQLMAQIRVGNIMLQAIDGKTERTFSVPCGEVNANGQNYLPEIQTDFVAIKSGGGTVTPDMKRLNPYAVRVVAPTDVSGKQLIDLVNAAADQGTMINPTFHGIGGDYLSVSNEAHEELLAYLAAHRKIYWTDTFINIMKYAKQEQTKTQ